MQDKLTLLGAGSWRQFEKNIWRVERAVSDGSDQEDEDKKT